MQNDKEKRKQLADLVKEKFKFRNVPYSDIEKMVSYCRFSFFPKNSYLIMQDDEIEYFYFILSGSVENHLITTKNGKKILTTLHAGDDFSFPDIIISCNINPKSIAYSLCLENCEVGMISRQDFMEHCFTIPSVNFAFAEMMAMIIQEMCNEFMLTDAESKVASLLCFLAKNSQKTTDGKIFIERSFSMQKFADVLRLARECVHRVLTDIEDRGIISISKQQIIVFDEKKLLEMSDNMTSMMGFYGMLE